MSEFADAVVTLTRQIGTEGTERLRRMAGAFRRALPSFGDHGNPNPAPVRLDLATENSNAALQALQDEDWDRLETMFTNDVLAGLDQLRSQVIQKLIDTDELVPALSKRPGLAAAILSMVDPAQLAGVDLDDELGDAKNTVLAKALQALAKKAVPNGADALDRGRDCDPALFSLLAKELPPEAWNDVAGGARGLGPRVLQSLWANRSFDQICELIDHGVDTTIAAPAEPGSKGRMNGVYSGFVQPLQHIAAKYLKDVGQLDDPDNELQPWQKTIATGAKRINAKLEEKGQAQTFTDWNALVGCEMLTQFEDNPGTIWGFEDIRIPYVQAAHETSRGMQPLRMIEIWDAVIEALPAAKYQQLIDDPNGFADTCIELGVAQIRKDLDNTTTPATMMKYAEIKQGDPETFIESFKLQAKSFLEEFAQMMPKGTFAAPYEDAAGQGRQWYDTENKMTQESGLSEVAGVHGGKWMSAMACKAGIWWAKQEGKPVYYVLDGIKMEDVVNYKKTKNAAIEDYLSGGGGANDPDLHREVITLVEIREILKNWDELKGTVMLVEKGKILKRDELNDKVELWQKEMKAANKQAGRAAAPPMATFTKQLHAIDPGLMDLLQEGLDDDDAQIKERDKDARDIVRKSGYLVKVAKARPQIVIKYLMSKCEVLLDYGLISPGLPDAAKAVANAKGRGAVNKAGELLLAEIRKCNPLFVKPLEDAIFQD